MDLDFRVFFFSSRRRHTRLQGDWSSDVCSSDLRWRCFTAFHRKMPQAATVYPGPYRWFESGIHRYGFHGVSHQYCAARAAQLLRRDLDRKSVVTCHLGNGCSLAAIHESHSIDTTMGFTPLEGLMMGTRSGSIDPGILTYLIRQGHLRPQEMDDVMNQ